MSLILSSKFRLFRKKKPYFLEKIDIAICTLDSIYAIQHFQKEYPEFSQDIYYIPDKNLEIFEKYQLRNEETFKKTLFLINYNTMIIEKLQENEDFSSFLTTIEFLLLN